jgi:hypothetical protein
MSIVPARFITPRKGNGFAMNRARSWATCCHVASHIVRVATSRMTDNNNSFEVELVLFCNGAKVVKEHRARGRIRGRRGLLRFILALCPSVWFHVSPYSLDCSTVY